MFYILANYSYYPGTFYAPKNGPLKDEGERLTFATREDAAAYLEEKGLTSYKNIYSHTTYYCNHGEYSAPTYRIRKVRGSKK